MFNDLRFGFRMLLKRPGFTAVAVLTLALGLGANTSIFSIISGFFFEPMPVKGADRLVLVLQRSAIWKLPHGHSWLDYQDYRQRVSGFEDVAAVLFTPVHLSLAGQQPERTWIEGVSGNCFSMLGIQPAYGRTFLPGEGQNPGADPVIVLSYRFWQRKCGGDPAAVGKSVSVNGRPFTIIGVAPAKFNGAEWAMAPSAFVPATMADPEMLKNRGWPGFKIMARLKPGVTVAQAQAQVEAVAKQLATDYPDSHREATVTVKPEMLCRPEPAFLDVVPLACLMFMVVVGLVLLIACANVANLMLSRALVRQKEMGIRTAIGASRWRLMRQLLVESILLALLGGVVGTALAWWTGGLLAGFAPASDIPLRTDHHWDWRVFAFTFLASIVAGVATGLAPGLRATHLDINSILKDAGNSPLASRRHWFRSCLVVSQVALCVVVLISGGFFLQSLWLAGRLDLGFRSENLLMASLDLGLQGYDDARGRQFHEKLVDRMRTIPGVRNVALAGSVPFDYMVLVGEFGPEGRTSGAAGSGQDGYVVGSYATADPNYLPTMGITLVQGRNFTRFDNETAPKVAIINQVLAQRLWPGGNAVGKQFHFHRGGDLTEVVGVVRDGKYVMIGEEPRPFAYLPLAQHYLSPVSVHVRTEGAPLLLAPALRQVLSELDPALPVYNVRSMEEHLRSSAFGLMPLRMGATLAGVQGALGLVLAMMGIYGVVSYVVSQQTKEIGIRMALGARKADVIRLVVRGGARLAVVGLGVGLVFGLALALVLTHMLYGLKPSSLPVFAIVFSLLTGVSFLACYVPARRATRVDPMVALRYE